MFSGCIPVIDSYSLKNFQSIHLVVCFLYICSLKGFTCALYFSITQGALPSQLLVSTSHIGVFRFTCRRLKHTWAAAAWVCWPLLSASLLCEGKTAPCSKTAHTESPGGSSVTDETLLAPPSLTRLCLDIAAFSSALVLVALKR